VRELTKLRSESDTVSIKSQSFTGEKEISTGEISLMQSELLFDFKFLDTRVDSLGIILENGLKERFITGYSAAQKQFYIDRRVSGNSGFSKNFATISKAPYFAGTDLKLHMFVDASSVELFVDDGRLVMTSLVFPTEKFTRLILFSKNGNVILNKAEFHGIERIWP
jgi:sucrose-6-phosphate hydrolase SacC (GH32 family)